MKELQKYYTQELHVRSQNCTPKCKEIYLAAEADAAFAEMELRNINLQYQRDGLCIQIMVMEQQHAEEIERLKAEHQEGLAGFHRRLYSLQEETDSLNHDFKNFHRLLCDRFGYVHDERDWRRDQVSLIEHIASLRKQAERYEKLRKITPTEFERIFWDSDDTDSSFDALVDQLPASGDFSGEQTP